MKNIVKLMKEQGNQFDWSSIVIDLSELPCFKPEAEWPPEAQLGDLLADGYATVSLSVGHTRYTFVVKPTGSNPSVSTSSFGPVFTDCEPVTVEPVLPLEAVPAIVIAEGTFGLSYETVFGLQDDIGVVYPMFLGGPDEADMKGYIGNKFQEEV